MSNLDDLNKRPDDAERNLSEKKGIDLFFGDKEMDFFDTVGKEITNDIVNTSFILYRIDLVRTKTHALYGEAIVKEYKSPIEIFGRLNVISEGPKYRTNHGVVKQGMGEFTGSLYLSHLEEIGLIEEDGSDLIVDLNKGDFIAYKGQFYEVYDDGYSQIANEFSIAADRRLWLKIKAKEVDKDIFNGI